MEQEIASPKKGGKWKLIAIVILILLVSFEIGGRMYISSEENVPFFNPSKMIHNFYPDVAKLKEYDGDRSKEFRVLLLGGSVLHPSHGDVGGRIEWELYDEAKAAGKEVKVFNLAEDGFMSLDSRIILELLDGFEVDVIFVYHGISDVRANNVPEELYQDDYSHIREYKMIRTVQDHGGMNVSIIPFLFGRMSAKGHMQDHPEEYISRDVAPDEFWIKHGEKIKTKEAFRRNISEIVDIAQSRNTPIYLGTFATFLPKYYSKSRLDSGRYAGFNPDAEQPPVPVENWGTPTNVMNTVGVHNEVIKSVAAEKKVPVIDIKEVVYRNAVNYDDICHMSNSGSLYFGRAVGAALADLVAKEE